MSTSKDTGNKVFSTAILVVLVLAAVAGAYMIGKNNGGKSSDNSIALATPTNTSSTSSPSSTNGTTSTSSNKTAQNGSTKSTSKTARLQSYGFFYLAGKVQAVDDKYLSVKTDNGQVVKVAYGNDARVIYPVASKITVTKPENIPKPASGTANTNPSGSTSVAGGSATASKPKSTNTQAGKSQDIKSIKIGTSVISSIKVNPDGTFIIRSVRISK